MLTCAHCSYTTNRTYNLNRHILTKHSCASTMPLQCNSMEQFINNMEQNINIKEQNINIEEQYINIDNQNINIKKSVEEASEDGTETPGNKEYKCKTCYKYFGYLKTLKRHIAVCKKIQHPYECMNCHKLFSCSSSLCVHRKGCISTALISVSAKNEPISNQNNITAHTIDTLNNNIIQNQQNIENQNNQNIENQNITINVFPSSFKSDFNIDTSHFDEASLKQKLKYQSIYEAVGTSLRLVLENRDNLPVKKKSIKSNYSYVHLGEDKWEMRKDKEIYGMISFHISRCIQVYLDGKNFDQLKKYYQEATEAFEFVATDNMVDLEREYVKKARRIMDVIFLAAYDRPDRDQMGTIVCNKQ